MCVCKYLYMHSTPNCVLGHFQWHWPFRGHSFHGPDLIYIINRNGHFSKTVTDSSFPLLARGVLSTPLSLLCNWHHANHVHLNHFAHKYLNQNTKNICFLSLIGRSKHRKCVAFGSFDRQQFCVYVALIWSFFP